MPSGDSELIDSLKDAINAAHAQDAESLSNPTWPKKDIFELSRPLVDVLLRHAEFKACPNKSFLGRALGFAPYTIAYNLLEYSIRTNANEGVNWLRRVVATQQTSVRVIGKVHGLLVNKTYSFSNKLRLMRAGSLPPRSSIRLEFRHGAPISDYPSAIVMTLEDVTDGDPDAGRAQFLDIVESMRTTVYAFSLAGDARPTLTETWIEFANSDLEAAEFGRVFQMSQSDGAVPSYPSNVTDENIQWIERFLSLPDEVASYCKVPLSRLNLAQRRITAGDRALDGCISLEALLSSRSQGELTHKVATRSALLLGRSIDERRSIRRSVAELYKLRSKVVHGSYNANTSKDRTIADQGLELVRRALCAIIVSRAIPIPDDWELAGGPIWNRLTE